MHHVNTYFYYLILYGYTSYLSDHILYQTGFSSCYPIVNHYIMFIMYSQGIDNKKNKTVIIITRTSRNYIICRICFSLRCYWNCKNPCERKLILFNIKFIEFKWRENNIQKTRHAYWQQGLVRVMVFNATFNNTSVISWRSVLLVEKTGVPRGNHQPFVSH